MNQAYQQPQTGTYSADQTLALVNAFMRRVYNWMALGLGLSAVSAYVVSNTSAIFYFINAQTGAPTMAYWVVLIATFGLAIGMSAGIRRIQVGTAATLFIIYGALMGIFLAPVLLLYTQASVFKTFLVTAGTFGITSIWATTTKKDLSGWGSFLFMGLIGIILASVVNIFLGSQMMDWVISIIGVGLFIGLTAYDTQQLRAMVLEAANETTVSKMAIFGALKLYLDFINLFLFLLRFLGERR
jgi:FtsH-binding integral membrane protein